MSDEPETSTSRPLTIPDWVARAKAAQQVVDDLGAGKPQPPLTSDLEKLLAFLQKEGGMISIVCDPPDARRHPNDWQFSVGMTFGQEDEDSDMAAGASYSIGSSLAECLSDVVAEVRL